jgi:hypothetical protein
MSALRLAMERIGGGGDDGEADFDAGDDGELLVR